MAGSDSGVVGRPQKPVSTIHLRVDAGRGRSGDREASTRRLNALQDVPLLPITDAVERLTNALIMERAVPTGSRIDAAHVAVSAIHGIDYLLTWNFRHMANAGTRPLIRALCETHGYSSPEICTPFELMGLIGDIKDG